MTLPADEQPRVTVLIRERDGDEHCYKMRLRLAMGLGGLSEWAPMGPDECGTNQAHIGGQWITALAGWASDDGRTLCIFAAVD